jgi:light-regulated signal transduction histidine kinase (bacteriophytochrome)
MLITDILDFARIEAAKLELSPTQLRLPEFLQVVTDIIRIKAEQKNLELVYQPTPDLPMVIRADEKRLRQIPLDALIERHRAHDEGQARDVTAVVSEGWPAGRANHLI